MCDPWPYGKHTRVHTHTQVHSRQQSIWCLFDDCAVIDAVMQCRCLCRLIIVPPSCSCLSSLTRAQPIKEQECAPSALSSPSVRHSSTFLSRIRPLIHLSSPSAWSEGDCLALTAGALPRLQKVETDSEPPCQCRGSTHFHNQQQRHRRRDSAL